MKEVINILVKPTDGCNLRCIYCYHADYEYSTDTMPIYYLTSLLEKSAKEYNKIRLIWHGGEPLTVGLEYYKRAIEEERRIEALTGVVITNAMQTNGTLLSKELYELLKNEGFTFGFSYDGPTNEYARGLTYKTEEAFRYLNSDNTRVSTIKVLLRDDLKDILNVYRFYRDRHYNVRLNPLFHCDLVNENSLEYSVSQYCEAMKLLFDYYIEDETCDIKVDPFESYMSLMCKGEEFHRICSHASCLSQFICMNSNGDIYPCSRNYPEEYCLGNIMNVDTIEDIFKGERFEYILRKAISRRRTCIEECELYKYCLGGCNHDALMAGALEKSNHFSCISFKIIFPYIRDYLESITDEKQIRNRRLIPFWKAMTAGKSENNSNVSEFCE